MRRTQPCRPCPLILYHVVITRPAGRIWAKGVPASLRIVLSQLTTHRTAVIQRLGTVAEAERHRYE